jgi:hypothetical protein
MIKTPFANYKRAHLERLVHEAFEHIEREANRLENEATQWVENEATQWGTTSGLPMDQFDFQVLMAAKHYLETTK